VAGAVNGRHQKAALSFWPSVHGPYGGARTTHSKGVRALRLACLVV
jgi:hypothetical protein